MLSICLFSFLYSIYRPPFTGQINSYDSQSTNFQLYGNFTFRIDGINATDTFVFQAGPVAVLNDINSTIITPIQSNAEITRLLLLKYSIQKKTYTQSSWTLKDGMFYYLQYDEKRDRLLSLRDNGSQVFILEQYNSTTLDLIQECARQTRDQYGFPSLVNPIFDADENWIVELRQPGGKGAGDIYYLKMDLNLIGKKDDIVTDYHRIQQLDDLYSVIYDRKAKLALVASQRGNISPKIIIFYMNPSTGAFQQEVSIFDKPFGWPVQSFQSFFDASTRQVLYLIKITDLQFVRMQIWSIIVDFDTLKVIEKKQINTLNDLQDWSFFQIVDK